jgi:peptide deformylase
MAIRQILKLGDGTLRQKSREVTVFDARLSELIDDLFDTMYKAGGVGLAAPQVGVLRRVCVVDTGKGKPLELVNPVLIKADGEVTDDEGCLSIPDRNEKIKRPQKVTVKAYNRKGKEITVKGEGFSGRALCHEIDHLDGVLYIDLVSPPLN